MEKGVLTNLFKETMYKRLKAATKAAVEKYRKDEHLNTRGAKETRRSGPQKKANKQGRRSG